MCLEGVWNVSNLCSASPTKLGTSFYLELEFDPGADPASLSFFTQLKFKVTEDHDRDHILRALFSYTA